MTLAKGFSTALKTYRRDAGLTQEQLAARAGVSMRTIRNLEQGTYRTAQRETVRLVAEALALPECDRAALLALAAASDVHQKGGSGQAPPLSLPLPPAPCLGRSDEILRIRSLLRDRIVRLITLSGPPGVGKTRLALEIGGQEVGDWPDGVFFVALELFTNRKGVVEELARALSIHERRDMTTEDAIVEFLAEKSLLLLLDNFEQALEAAPFVAELLRRAPGLKVLITSRERLNVRGEHEICVPPMPVPAVPVELSVDACSRYPAVRLFVARAQAADDTFALAEENVADVVHVCQYVDGLPLAIELAAARVKVLPPSSLAAALHRRLPVLIRGSRDLPQRQRSLRSAMKWSYDLLTRSEQRVFRQMAVFQGGCTLAAGEVVCDVRDDNEETVFDLIASLVDKSLMHRVDPCAIHPRYVMLPTVREYAWELLDQVKEGSAAQQRHAKYYLALAEEAEVKLASPQQAVSIAQLEAEHANFRSALLWARDQDHGDLGLRLAGALGQFWLLRGHVSEGRRWLSCFVKTEKLVGEGADILIACKGLAAVGALANAQSDYPSAVEAYEQCLLLYRRQEDVRGIANTLNAIGIVLRDRAEYESSAAHFWESLQLQRQLGDRQGIASALNNLGSIANLQSDFDRAENFYFESLDLCRTLGNMRGVALVTSNLAVVATSRGERERARALLQEALTLYVTLQNVQGIASTHNNLGMLSNDEERYAEAGVHLRKSLELFAQIQDVRGIIAALDNLGEAARLQGRTDEAKALYLEALRLARRTGAHYNTSILLMLLGNVSRDQRDFQLARAHYRESLQQQRRVHDAATIVKCVEGIAALAFMEGRPRPSVMLLAWSVLARNDIGMTYTPVDQAVHEKLAADLHRTLDADALHTSQAGVEPKTLDDLIQSGLSYLNEDSTTEEG